MAGNSLYKLSDWGCLGLCKFMFRDGSVRSRNANLPFGFLLTSCNVNEKANKAQMMKMALINPHDASFAYL